MRLLMATTIKRISSSASVFNQATLFQLTEKDEKRNRKDEYGAEDHTESHTTGKVECAVKFGI